MAEPAKYTRQSANQLLAEVSRRLERLQEAYPVVQKMRAASIGNGGGPATGEWKKTLAGYNEDLEWFSDAGIIVRDITRGLIDFPSEKEGEDILLCWKAGEPAVDFWHYPDAGFAGRQPL